MPPVEWPALTPSTSPRYRSEDVRQFASRLLARLGVSAPRASAMASHLLWFDAAGASSHGITSLANWLERLERGEIDPKAEGRAGRERAGTAVFDGQGGLAPLALAKAAGIAAEKARDVGVGIVRLVGIGPPGPTAPSVADLAIGPFLSVIVGPGPSMAMGLPMPGGLPALYDSTLGGGPASMGGLDALAPWIGALSGGEGWTILALAVASMETLPGFHGRVADSFRLANGPSQLAPEAWESSRAEFRDRGVILEASPAKALRSWSERLNVEWPSPLAG